MGRWGTRKDFQAGALADLKPESSGRRGWWVLRLVAPATPPVRRLLGATQGWDSSSSLADEPRLWSRPLPPRLDTDT